MQVNKINILIGTLIIALLAWWLWLMGGTTLQKWLLAAVGGVLMEVGMFGGMCIKFEKSRANIQVKLILNIMTVIVFIASAIFSFFNFSPEGYVIPVGVFSLLCIALAIKIYNTKM